MGFFSSFFAKPHPPEPAVMDGPVDPSTMTTPVGREIAARVNRAIEVSDQNAHRFLKVVNDYILYVDNAQIDLAETAIIWALAALAQHERRSECETHFYTFVDAMYAQTDDAQRNFTESQREKMVAEACALERSLLPAINEILPSSLKKLGTYDAKSFFRITAESLRSVRKNYLDHAPRVALRDLTVRCVILAETLDAYSLGLGSEQKVVAEAQLAIDSCHGIISTVHDAVDAGKLLVINGKITTRDQTGAS